MSKGHLVKHQNDYGRTLKCHNFRDQDKIGRTFVFAIIWMALNDIEDDIQISDLLRFIKESHLKYNNISSYLPANIDCSHAISDFRKSAIECESHYRLRQKALAVAKVIHMRTMKVPDLVKLCERYVKELCLPSGIINIIGNLIDFNPPRMRLKYKNARTVPNYEGRAMAYILFVLKLLFGLDGDREQRISDSAKKINATLAYDNEAKHNELFVWTEWVEYIEMRSVILSQCHYPTAIHLDPKAPVHPDLYVSYIKKTNEDNAYRETFRKTEMENLHIIFEKLIQLHEPKETERSISFPPTTTPFSTYFEQILKSEFIKTQVKVPDFMYVDHEARDIHSFLNCKDLKKNVHKLGFNLRAHKIGYNKNMTFVPLPVSNQSATRQYCKFNFDIKVRQWRDLIAPTDECSKENINEDFNEVMTHEINDHLKSLETNKSNKKTEMSKLRDQSKASSAEDHMEHSPDMFSIPSYQYFDEQERDIDDDCILSEPRRNLESLLNVVEDSSSEEDSETSPDESDNNIDFSHSNFDYWIFMENINLMTNTSFEDTLMTLPTSFQWLLKQCAMQLHMNVKDLYIELLAIENQFRYILEPIHIMESCIKYRTLTKNGLPLRLLTAVNHLKQIW